MSDVPAREWRFYLDDMIGFVEWSDGLQSCSTKLVACYTTCL